MLLLIASCAPQCGLLGDHGPPRGEVLRDNDALDLDRALKLGRRGKPETARAYLCALRERCPDSFRVQRALQDLLLEAGPAGEAELAKEHYDTLPEDSAFHLTLKARFLTRPEDQQALLRRALELDPQFVWALLGLALNERRADNLEAARDQLLRALDVWDEFPEALRDLAEVEDALGDYEDARGRYERYLRIRPADRDARFDYAVLLWTALGHAAEADVQFSVLLQQNAGDLDALAWHANMLTYEQRYPQAIELYEQVVAQDARRPNIYYNLGWIYEAMHDDQKALEYYTRFLNADVGDTETRSVFDLLFFVPSRIHALLARSGSKG
ncbi:MAG: tetratricopeptide repeat protein [Planctomycetota bacterium]